MKCVKPVLNRKHVDLAEDDKRDGVQSLRPKYRSRTKHRSKDHTINNNKRERDDITIMTDQPLRKSPRLQAMGNTSALLITQGKPLIYKDENPIEDQVYETEQEVDLEALLHDNSHVHRLVEHAMLGDALASHVMKNEFVCILLNPEPNTIKQALSLPDRKSWKEAIDAELQMIKDFNVFSEPMPLPPGAKVLNQRWVFKRTR